MSRDINPIKKPKNKSAFFMRPSLQINKGSSIAYRIFVTEDKKGGKRPPLQKMKRLLKKILKTATEGNTKKSPYIVTKDSKLINHLDHNVCRLLKPYLKVNKFRDIEIDLRRAAVKIMDDPRSTLPISVGQGDAFSSGIKGFHFPAKMNENKENSSPLMRRLFDKHFKQFKELVNEKVSQFTEDKDYVRDLQNIFRKVARQNMKDYRKEMGLNYEVHVHGEHSDTRTRLIERNGTDEDLKDILSQMFRNGTIIFEKPCITIKDEIYKCE